MAKIREKDKTAILNAIAGGVTPRQGIQHIQVGRKEEVSAIVRDLDHVEQGGGAFRIFMADWGAGKSFMLSLCKTVFMKRNAVCSIVDLSADKRLYSSGTGHALNTYREIMRNLSTPMHPDGGALEEILTSIDEKMLSNLDQSFLEEIRRMPFGFDAITVLGQWHIACNPTTPKEERDAFMLKDTCLRWFSGEATQEHRRKFGVRALVGDDTMFDMLKMFAMLCHYAGYAGLHILYDEVESIFRINNTTSRERNYLAILTQLNAALQGDCPYLNLIFSCTVPTVMDPRRGMASHPALYARLQDTGYSGEGPDTTGPILQLQRLSNEDLVVLLRNIANVCALGDQDKMLVTDQQIVSFLTAQFSTLGSEEKTTREISRAWVTILRMLENDPELSFDDVVGEVEVKKEMPQSSLGAALSGAPDEEEDEARPNVSVLGNADGDDGFGF